MKDLYLLLSGLSFLPLLLLLDLNPLWQWDWYAEVVGTFVQQNGRLVFNYMLLAFCNGAAISGWHETPGSEKVLQLS